MRLMMVPLKKLFDLKKLFLSKIISGFAVDAKKGLGRPLFEAISGITPNVNVDLLCYDRKKRFALVFREDKFYGPGWHIPGGVLRFKEKLITRLYLTAETELKLEEIESVSRVNISEIFATDRDVRGHFISFLYKAKSFELDNLDDYDPAVKYIDGSIAMFYDPPEDIIRQHKQFSYLM